MMRDQLNALEKEVRAVYLAAEDLPVAASLLFLAYHDDPLFQQLFQADKADYEQRLRAAIREELQAFARAEQPLIGIFHDDQLWGVACVVGPDAGQQGGRLWHWRLRMLLTAGYVSTRQLLEKEKRIREAIPHKHYHMLAFLAVHPLQQQHGFGHYLLGAVDTLVAETPDSAGVGVFVTRDQYLPLFQHNGYQTLTPLRFSKITGQLLFKARQTDS